MAPRGNLSIRRPGPAGAWLTFPVSATPRSAPGASVSAHAGRIRAGTWSAPGRVNLIGDHTDYNAGFALPFALPLRTTATVRARVDATVTATSNGHEPVRFTTDTRPGDVTGWGAYVAGVVWAVGRHLGTAVPGFDVDLTSQIPRGSGLSSSHSLECALALAVLDLAGAQLSTAELALLIQRAENEYVGAPTGLLDQTAILASREGHLSFFDARDQTVEPVPCDFAAAGLSVLVVDPHAPHALVDGAYAARRTACERAAEHLGVATLRDVEDPAAALAALDDPELVRRVRHVLTENARVLACVDLARQDRLAEIGSLLTRSHESMREDFENSVPTIDLVVETAVTAGALGARMTGGGFGGAVVALVERGRVADVESALTDATVAKGLPAPAFLEVVPSRGAGRDDATT